MSNDADYAADYDPHDDVEPESGQVDELDDTMSSLSPYGSLTVQNTGGTVEVVAGASLKPGDVVIFDGNGKAVASKSMNTQAQQNTHNALGTQQSMGVSLGGVLRGGPGPATYIAQGAYGPATDVSISQEALAEACTKAVNSALDARSAENTNVLNELKNRLTGIGFDTSKMDAKTVVDLVMSSVESPKQVAAGDKLLSEATHAEILRHLLPEFSIPDGISVQVAENKPPRITGTTGELLLSYEVPRP